MPDEARLREQARNSRAGGCPLADRIGLVPVWEPHAPSASGPSRRTKWSSRSSSSMTAASLA
jgi:hypothetical protein